MTQLDSDGSGAVDFEEFLEGMGKWFLGPSDNKQEENVLGMLWWRHWWWRHWWRIVGLEVDEIAEARKIFDAVDKDGSGKIDSSELKEAMQQSGKDPSDEEVPSYLFLFSLLYLFIIISIVIFLVTKLKIVVIQS